MKTRLLTLLLPALLLLCGCHDDAPADGSKINAGQPLPDFTAEMADGSTVTSADFLGRSGMIVFFNTGCTDCRLEFPALQQAYEEVAAWENPPLVVCIAREQTDPDIAAYWSLQHLTLPYSPQPDRRIYSLFADRDIPRIYIVGADGRVTTLYGPTSRPSAATLVADMRAAASR